MVAAMGWVASALAWPTACARPPRSVAAAPSVRAVLWDYDVEFAEPAGELTVDARFAGASGSFTLDRDAARFVRGVEIADGARWVAAAQDGADWEIPCGPKGCHVRYRFALRDAAEAIRDVETAIASGDVYVAPPSTWLLHPEAAPPDGRFRFRVHASLPARFAAGTSRAPDGATDTFEAAIETIDVASFAVFGRFDAVPITRGRALVDVAVAPSGLALSTSDVRAWIGGAVDALDAYFGGFPSAHVLVVVLAGGGGSTRGETLGAGGPAVVLRAGSALRASTTADDWVATHELIHAVLPSLPRAQSWLEEGVATYVEPIARARIGTVTPEKMWGDLALGIPQGLPEAGDEGLDRTHTWGRTYWGGALFCLEADVEIRERTGNQKSLDDVLRAAARSGDDATNWTIDRFLDEAERATGTRVVRDLYERMALAPGSVDLGHLWTRLGVHVDGKRVSFDDGAPLAGIRRAITRRP
jgi:hypothetical protein